MATLSAREIAAIYTNKSAIADRLYYGLNQYNEVTTYRGLANGKLEVFTNANTTSFVPDTNNEGTTAQEGIDINAEALTQKLSSVVGGTDISIDDTDPINPIINFVGTGVVASVSATLPITSSGGVNPVISTSMATNKLIGRGTAGPGVMEEITLGTNLSLTGTTLNVSSSVGNTDYTLSFLLMGA